MLIENEKMQLPKTSFETSVTYQPIFSKRKKQKQLFLSRNNLKETICSVKSTFG